MSHTLLVLAHHRPTSLTAQLAAETRRTIEAAGGTVDLLDLYAEDFDPRLYEADDPDWDDREKRYSPEVRAHMRRIDAADDIVVVFPVWWFGPPAILKGWIDRVWNYGFAYGRSTPRLRAKRMLWLAPAGGTRAEFEANGLEASMDRQLRVGISEFCGIGDARVRLLYGAELSGVPETLRQGRAREVLAAGAAALAEFRAARRRPGDVTLDTEGEADVSGETEPVSA
ncbi:NAD(P)H oxidoreductase [Streptomyces boninensis]|uniref:NAD(P)H oxidoreductase n=1 Tax=Streptomyces boninensis TaxID=2039455 RepID=UPI003B2112C4